MSDIVDFLKEENPLSLPYFKCHRIVLETFISADLTATAQRLYLFMSHNCLIHQAVSFKLPIKEISEFFGKSPRTVYRALAELDASGLISIRHHGDIVVDLPAIRMAQIEAKGLAIESSARETEEAFRAEVDAVLEEIESTLGRSLSARERETFTRRMLTKRMADRKG